MPGCGALEQCDEDLRNGAAVMVEKYAQLMDNMQFSLALSEVWNHISACNRYIDLNMPWVLAKDEAKRERLGTVLYHLAESLRIVAVLLQPCLTRCPEKIFAQLGLDINDATWQSAQQFGLLPAGVQVTAQPALFPRIDLAKELEELAALKKAAEPEVPETAPIKPEITIDDFAKVDLRIANVTAAEKVAKSDKLLKLTVEVGGKPRTVVSGIAQHFTPEEMVGKQVVLVANLKPAKLRGIVSEGMILCAEDKDGKLVLAAPGAPALSGSEVC